jgi:hypothetical protein
MPNAAAEYAAPSQSNVRKITFSQWSLGYLPRLHRRHLRHRIKPREFAMTHTYAASAARRANPALALGLLVALAAAGSARAELATPQQKKALRPASTVSAPARFRM